jgi:hypothetical protein
MKQAFAVENNLMKCFGWNEAPVFFFFFLKKKEARAENLAPGS